MTAEAADPRITTRRVHYGNALEGFLAVPNTPGPHPVMILLHERYGLMQHNYDLAHRFAREGYLCLAPNMYSRDPEPEKLANGEIYRRIPDSVVLEDLNASIEYLRNEPADFSHLAIMGVCISGRWPLVAASQRNDVSACVALYGGAYPNGWVLDEIHPETVEALISRIQCPVLGMFGERDFIIPLDYVRRFRDGLETHRKSYHIRMFYGVPHGWLNDTMPPRYHEPEAVEAWDLLMSFLKKVRSGGYPADRVRWTFESEIAPDYDPAKNVPV
jgi:carboxymethylenebutenolidase